jgi:hypothetical protein
MKETISKYYTTKMALPELNMCKIKKKSSFYHGPAMYEFPVGQRSANCMFASSHVLSLLQEN